MFLLNLNLQFLIIISVRNNQTKCSFTQGLRERAEAGALLFASDVIAKKQNAELPLNASEQDTNPFLNFSPITLCNRTY